MHLHMFKTIIKLKSMIPEDFKIIIKEHPSQFYHKDHGSRGRSPLFYKLIKNISNVELVDTNENTIKLILNSVFIATITGTVALESSLLGKKTLFFGNPWYRGLPNTFDIKSKPSFEEIIDAPLSGVNQIKFFLKSLFKNNSIPVYMNWTTKSLYEEKFGDLIEKKMNRHLSEYLEFFFKNFNSN